MDPFSFNKNLRTPSLHALKQANVQYSECVAKNFMADWLAGKNVSLSDVCQEEYAKMTELDAENYPPLPFKPAPT